jgi:transcription antitermination factor NusG
MSVLAESLPDWLSASQVSDALSWYAVYTYPRHEKAVKDQLDWKAVEVFLPTFASERRWKDRKVSIDLPLFPGYIFTRIHPSERIKVLSTPSVVRMLSFNGVPAPIAASEIDAIRRCLESSAVLQKHPFLKVGERVRVTRGAFEGLEGVVVRHKNGCKLVLSINLIHQSVSLEVAADLLEPLQRSM